MTKKRPFDHLGISWQTMKVGKLEYKGTATGAKANASRANKLYAPKRWRTYSEEGKVYVERLPDIERTENHD